jgi:hypothetical protein
MCGSWHTAISKVANEVGISYGSAQAVLTGLRMRRVCGKFHNCLLINKGSAGSATILGKKKKKSHSFCSHVNHQTLYHVTFGSSID